MKWVKHDFGEWAVMTQGMSLSEKGALQSLLQWQYVHEDVLPAAPAELRKITHAVSRDDVLAVNRAIELHFVPTELGWVHPPAWEHMVELGRFDDRPDLKLLQLGVTPSRAVTRHMLVTASPSPSPRHMRPMSRDVTSQRQRQRELRERKSGLYSLLAEKDVFPRADAPIGELRNLCATHGIAVEKLSRRHENVTRNVTPHAPALNSIQGPEQPDGGNSARTGDSARDGAASPTSLNGTAAGAAGRALREGGISPLEINTHHPKLLALLEAGCSLDELRGAAVSAVSKGKGFAYALAMLEGQRRDQGPIAPRIDVMNLWTGKQP